MIHPYAKLLGYKIWADHGLYAVVTEMFGRLGDQDQSILLRILDHIHTVDRIFQHHLQGSQHTFHAPRSAHTPGLRTLSEDSKAVDEWYLGYAAGLAAPDFDKPVDFVFTDGRPGRLTRGEILLHVCLHGTYHRGNAGLLLQKNGIPPNDDRMTDYLEAARSLSMAGGWL